MIKRFQYRCSFKESADTDKLVDACKERAKRLIEEGKLCNVSFYRYENMGFLYVEEITGTEPIKAEVLMNELIPSLKPWPREEGDVFFVPMINVYYHRIPEEDPEAWEHERTTAAKTRVGRIAFVFPEKMPSYVKHHTAIVEEGLLKGDKYAFISMHENLLFSYYEEPRNNMNISGGEAESEAMAKWLAVDPESHFDRDKAQGDNFLVIPCLFSVDRVDFRGKASFFVEGLQGSGKSTLTEKLARANQNHLVFREGDYSPVELAWCAYVTKDKYRKILEKYSAIRPLIEENSREEGDRVIICYTRVMTDVPGFHKDLEQYEIYNGRLSFAEFKKTVFDRYRNWRGSGMIFECSLLQNIVEDMILYRNASDSEIMDFYSELAEILRDRNFRIYYLETENIAENIGVIRKERSDENGNEMWFPLMCAYFNDSPYAKARGISGEEELLKHFAHRQELELRVCREIFPDRTVFLKSKSYSDGDLI